MSEIRANTVSNAAGTGPATLTGQSAAKVWANLNGTGTIALRDSFNVSSVTDGGVGVYSFSYTNAMATANNAVKLGVRRDAVSATPALIALRNTVGPTTTSVDILTTDLAGATLDALEAMIGIHGDLA